LSHLTPEYLKNPVSTLEKIRDELFQNLSSCTLCPNKCQVNRLKGELGICQAPNFLKLGSFAVHPGEEPSISGTNGSGTIFYSHCTLRCIYCQNYPLSQLHHGKKYTTDELSDIFLSLQKKGCHNINMVSPTQFLPFMLDALIKAREKGLTIPIVYNTSGWENEWIVKLLHYFVDIFLVDSRYSSNETAFAYSGCRSYVEVNQKALQLMAERYPKALFDQEIMQKGIIVRVLVLPEHSTETIQILRHLKYWLGTDIHISLMSQYFPCWKALEHPTLNRRITTEEYEEVCTALETLGFSKGWTQDHESNETN
jgi:putative pyruvate formate lyase activating enzyme